MGSPEEMGAPPSGSELPWFSSECSLEICLQTRHKKDPLETQQTSAVTRTPLPRPGHHGGKLQPGRRQAPAGTTDRGLQDAPHWVFDVQLQSLDVLRPGHTWSLSLIGDVGTGEQNLRLSDGLLSLQYGRNSTDQLGSI